MEFKKTTNKYAQENSIRSAAKKVSWLEKSLLVGPKGRESNIHEREKIQTWWWSETYRCWELDEKVLRWIQQWHSNMLRVSKKFIMFKAKSMIKNVATMKSSKLNLSLVMVDKIHEMEQPFYAKTNNNSTKEPLLPYD